MAEKAAGEEDELKLPRAALNKMIKEFAPNIRVANDARELVLNCCTEFVHFISSEANEVCNRQQKKTISSEHVLTALENLGFGCYKLEAEACVEEAKQVAMKKRRQSSRLENLGIPEEELFRQQQELIAKARMEQAALEQQEWAQLQLAAAMQQQQQQASGATAAAAASAAAAVASASVMSALPQCSSAGSAAGNGDDDDYS